MKTYNLAKIALIKHRPKMTRTNRQVFPLFAALCLSACAAHTIDSSPSPSKDVPMSFSLKASTPVSTAKWYESFGNPALNGLIETALQNNLDVVQATARLRQAGFLTDAVSATRLPAVGLQTESRASREENSDTETSVGAGVALDWEIDAFNRIGATVTARNLEEKAAADDIEAVRLSLSAEVAEAYFNAVAQNTQLRMLRLQSDTDGHLLDLIKQRQDAGIGTSVEVLQQQGQLADNDSLIPPTEANLRVFENRLDVLTGAAPDAVDRVNAAEDFKDVGTLPAIGIPSNLLLNRPDLRALKNQLVAQDAEIAAAIADRLPRITLSGSYMLAAGPDAGTGFAANAVAGLVQPLLDWGQRKAEVERNKALYEERLAGFTQAYLEAIEDVENALYQETKQREFIERLEARKNVLNDTLSAAQSIYTQGESDYLPVLNAVRDLRLVERSLVTQQLNLILYRIQLYRALGGQAYEGAA